MEEVQEGEVKVEEGEVRGKEGVAAAAWRRMTSRSGA
jgi:hypothetical protein